MSRVHRLHLRALSVGVASLLGVQPIAAQTASGLAIQVVEASPGQNIISQETTPLKVRVMDRTGRVIPGASVLFVAPEEGPTGQFLPNANQIRVATDSQGMAIAPRFRTNDQIGEYQIQVIASYKDAISRTVIPQSNVARRKSSSKKFIILSALIGGAVAAVVATKAKGGSSFTPGMPASVPAPAPAPAPAPIPLTLSFSSSFTSGTPGTTP